MSIVSLSISAAVNITDSLHGDEMPDRKAVSGRESWNEKVFAELSGLIGSQKANAIALRFRQDLGQRFANIADHDLLRRDAHAVTSTAGMLGFDHLSRRAKSLDEACMAGGDIAVNISEVLLAKLHVGEILAEHFLLS